MCVSVPVSVNGLTCVCPFTSEQVEAQVIRKRKGKWRAAGYEGQPDRLHVLNTPGDSHSIAVACRRTLLDPSDEFRICTVGVC